MVKLYSDEYLKRIKEKDNKEKLVDITEYIPGIKINPHHARSLKREKVLVRETVAKMLKEASGYLPEGYTLVIEDGYREKRIQEIFFKQELRRQRKKHPSWPYKKIKEEASKYVADPDSYAPHLTGGAVDVTIHRKGKELYGLHERWLDKKIVPEEARKNRAWLAEIMEDVGFVGYPLEWWHWTYGDQNWAANKKKKYAIYKKI